MKLLDLFEAATAELYHKTELYNAAKILSDGYIALTASVGTSAEQKWQKTGKFYYLSTTRSKVGDYTLKGHYLEGVVLNLNGNWLNQRYETKPIDYWERSLSDRTSESEDRVYSSEPTIPLPKPVTKLITSIHILFELDKIKLSLDQDRLLRLRKLLLLAKTSGIPTYVYKTPNDWYTQNPNKRVPIDQLIKLMSPEKPKASWSRMPKDYLKVWRELYYKNNKKELSSEARRKVIYLYGFYLNDAISGLSADIHNVKSKNDPGLIKLLQIFKKLKINSPKEYIKWLEAKWEAIED